MAFTAKILSWRFHHLNIVGCLLKRGPTKGGVMGTQDPPPPSYAPEGFGIICNISVKHKSCIKKMHTDKGKTIP